MATSATGRRRQQWRQWRLIAAVVVGLWLMPAGLSASGAAVSGAAVSGAAVSGAAVSGAAVSGAAVSGAAVSGAAVSGAAVSGAAVSGAPSPAWSASAQLAVGSHRRPEPTWRRLLRSSGVAIWLLLFLSPLALAIFRQRRRKVSARRRLMWLISAALLVVASFLSATIVQRSLPRPALVRGHVESFAKVPAEGQVAIYAWGDSTMHGDVFAPRLTIPKVVTWALRDHGKSLFMQNLARGGAAIHEWRTGPLAEVLSDHERFHPRIILVYVGHNGEHHLGGSTTSRENAVKPASELRALAEAVRAAGATLILAQPVANTAGHPPLEPRHGVDVSPAQRAAFEASLTQALAALHAHQAEKALAAAVTARAISPKHAWAAFVQGRALRALGRARAAHAAFRRAHELDRDGQRVSPALNAAIAEICAAGLARCVDAAAAMHTEFSWLDDTAFIDLHHPVARGHLLIGLAFAAQIAVELNLAAPRTIPSVGRWPTELDPSAMTRERYLQTFSWYLQLALQHRDGYPRSRADALRRGATCLTALEPQIARLSGRKAQNLRRRIEVGRLLLAAAEGLRDETERRMAQVWRDHDGPPPSHPLDRPWMRAVVAEVLGVDGIARPGKK